MRKKLFNFTTKLLEHQIWDKITSEFDDEKSNLSKSLLTLFVFGTSCPLAIIYFLRRACLKKGDMLFFSEGLNQSKINGILIKKLNFSAFDDDLEVFSENRFQKINTFFYINLK